MHEAVKQATGIEIAKLTDANINLARSFAKQWLKNHGDNFFVSAEFLILLCDYAQDAETRAAEAERQRDKLAKELVNRTVELHDRWLGKLVAPGYMVFTSKEEAIKSILEWAAQED